MAGGKLFFPSVTQSSYCRKEKGCDRGGKKRGTQSAKEKARSPIFVIWPAQEGEDPKREQKKKGRKKKEEPKQKDTPPKELR